MSLARRQANRRNALKSTGPRTRNGKRRASKNALSHGLSQPIDPSQVGDALDRMQALLTKSGYQATHAFRIALCLLDYDRVERAEDELHHRMMCMVSGIALKDPRIPNSLDAAAPRQSARHRHSRAPLCQPEDRRRSAYRQDPTRRPQGRRILAENCQRQTLRPLPQAQP